MIDINHLITTTRQNRGSDLHLIVGEPPVARIDGMVNRYDMPPLTAEDVETAAKQLVGSTKHPYSPDTTDYDFCYVMPNGTRQRVNVFKQKGVRGIVLRMLNDVLPSFDTLGLPQIFKTIASQPRGLVLVTGPTGSGKTTTLAAMVDYINSTKRDHIITIEDPIEYLHTSKNCIVNQREVGVDVDSFSYALRSALREDPDVILVGEMRDLETISAAITAAETGHLVFGTLHTVGTAKTIDRLIDVFPPHQQQQIRTQLATVLRAVITQQLLPKKDDVGRLPAFEIMTVTDAISNLIRENKAFQINTIIQSNAKNGMVLLDSYLAALVKQGAISVEIAMDRAADRQTLEKLLV